MQPPVLLLNTDYRPLRVIAWQRAVCLLLEKRVTLVQDTPGREVRSASASLPWPSVLALKVYTRFQPRIRFTRANVMARDGYRCGYCGAHSSHSHTAHGGRARPAAMTIDHIVPRAHARGGRVCIRGGKSVPVTSWQNVTTACWPCNARKGARTPEQAGMTLRRRAGRPRYGEAIRIALARTPIPKEWSRFVPRDLRPAD